MTNHTPLDRIGAAAARTRCIGSQTLGWLANNAPPEVLADLADAFDAPQGRRFVPNLCVDPQPPAFAE